MHKQLLTRYINNDIPTSSELKEWFNAPVESFDITKFTVHWEFREAYIANIAFPLYTTEVISTLLCFLRGKKVLEVGSGIGYLAHVLSEKGIDITTIDNLSTKYCFGRNLIIKCDKQVLAFGKIKSKYDVVIMSWPDYESVFASRIISEMHKGQVLIYQGEGWGGCTGNDKFFRKLNKSFREIDILSDKLNHHHVQFNGIHDWWYVYRKIKNW